MLYWKHSVIYCPRAHSTYFKSTEVFFMKKFGRKKIAIALACTSILGGKSPTTLYPQTVEAAGRSVESSSKGLVNWVKNHKWPVIGGASAFVTAAIVSAVLGVKYLGKKDQKNPDEHEEKVDEKGKNKQNQVSSVTKKTDVKQGDDKNDKSKIAAENDEIIGRGVTNCTEEDVEEKDKQQFGKDFKKLKLLLSNQQEFEKRFVKAEHKVMEENKDKNRNENWHETVTSYDSLEKAEEELNINEIISYLRQIIFGEIKLKGFRFSNEGFDYSGYTSAFEADEFTALKLGFPKGQVKLVYTPKEKAIYQESTELLFNFK